MFKAFKNLGLGPTFSVSIQLHDSVTNDGTQSTSLPADVHLPHDAVSVNGVVIVNNSTQKSIPVHKLKLILVGGFTIVEGGNGALDIQTYDTLIQINPSVLPSGTYFTHAIHKTLNMLIQKGEVPPGNSEYPFMLPFPKHICPTFKSKDDAPSIQFKLYAGLWKTKSHDLEVTAYKELEVDIKRTVLWRKPTDVINEAGRLTGVDIFHKIVIPDHIYTTSEYFTATLTFEGTEGMNINSLKSELSLMEICNTEKRQYERRVTKAIKPEEFSTSKSSGADQHYGLVNFRVPIENVRPDFIPDTENPPMTVRHEVVIATTDGKFKVSIPIAVELAQVGSSTTRTFQAINPIPGRTPSLQSASSGGEHVAHPPPYTPIGSENLSAMPKPMAILATPSVRSDSIRANSVSTSGSPNIRGNFYGSPINSVQTPQMPKQPIVSPRAKTNSPMLYSQHGSPEYRVLVQHKPYRDDELLLYPDDIVVVLEKYDDGWAKGTNIQTRYTGIFPLCILSGFAPEIAVVDPYVEIALPLRSSSIDQYGDVDVVQKALLSSGNSMAKQMAPRGSIASTKSHTDAMAAAIASRRKASISAAIPKYMCVKYYAPNMSDELELYPGDVICITHNYGDGWAQGYNVITNIPGVFPLNCLSAEPIPEPAPHPGYSPVSAKSVLATTPVLNPNVYQGQPMTPTIPPPSHYSHYSDSMASPPVAVALPPTPVYASSDSGFGRPVVPAAAMMSPPMASSISTPPDSPRRKPSVTSSFSNNDSQHSSNSFSVAVPFTMAELDQLLVEAKVPPQEYVRMRPIVIQLESLNEKLLNGSIHPTKYIEERDLILKS
ncbi:uncharacterized protein BJ171DRAFT_158040 [Polychytrium aggregatum]|uniref:uncharacterized protein n=1 Tax=Polychytrium aggregatum TaxID=110093 RepID=UPI0022FDE7E9|nr:uncharacterized protein BJ171DRAFT_158040 [Polychytrium aggregatum]KAI9203012.1 hypothetical protein BJ171DRAFT_158040 [Polychytrium aggregatum]